MSQSMERMIVGIVTTALAGFGGFQTFQARDLRPQAEASELWMQANQECRKDLHAAYRNAREACLEMMRVHCPPGAVESALEEIYAGIE